MSSRRREALGIWVALTFSSAVLVHGVVHAVGARAFVWDSPAHVVMLLAAIGLLATVALRLGAAGSRAERRRRLALVRAALIPAGAAATLAGVGSQIAIAGALFLAEGAALDSERIALAIVSGLIALLCSAFVFRTTGERIIALLVALATTTLRTSAPSRPRRRPVPPSAPTEPYRLFIPNRPPPAFAR